MELCAQEEARKKLSQLVKKKDVRFTARGNAAIKLALILAKAHGCTKLLLPDQGGWLTYPQFGKQQGFEVLHFTTDDGFILPEMIPKENNAVLLINTMPAYAFSIDAKKIANYCKEHNIFFINDVSATIGRPEASFGDICIGSCNHWKPLPLEEGGFIAAESLPHEQEPKMQYERLLDLLATLKERTQTIYKRAHELKEFLKNESILHQNHEGLNVIVAFKDDEDKERLINLVKTFDTSLEHTLCPRYIRVQRPAISFELKKQL
jgi:hypothetical protein